MPEKVKYCWRRGRRHKFDPWEKLSSGSSSVRKCKVCGKSQFSHPYQHEMFLDPETQQRRRMERELEALKKRLDQLERGVSE